MSISRRDALRGAGAAVAVAAAAAAVPAIAVAKSQGADTALKETAARWHRLYEKFKVANLFDEAHPEAEDEYYDRGYGDVSGDFWTVHKELSDARPKTLAGVVALLGCAERNVADRRRRRAGEHVPEIVYFVHPNAIQANSYDALKRLAGEARS